MADTNAERQAAFKERQRGDGMVQVTLWVHADDKRTLERKAVTLRASRERRRKSKAPAK
jgi:hypothetical protein